MDLSHAASPALAIDAFPPAVESTESRDGLAKLQRFLSCGGGAAAARRCWESFPFSFFPLPPPSRLRNHRAAFPIACRNSLPHAGHREREREREEGSAPRALPAKQKQSRSDEGEEAASIRG
jgi:hypothetical protein